MSEKKSSKNNLVAWSRWASEVIDVAGKVVFGAVRVRTKRETVEQIKERAYAEARQRITEVKDSAGLEAAFEERAAQQTQRPSSGSVNCYTAASFTTLYPSAEEARKRDAKAEQHRKDLKDVIARYRE